MNGKELGILGGVAALGVVLALLLGALGAWFGGEYPGESELAVRVVASTLSGVAWLAKNFSVTYNPGPYEHANFAENSQSQYFYYLYALERAGMLLDLPSIGKHEWYPEGANAILAAQKADGSWFGGVQRCNSTWDTCFAVLFLKKAAA